MRLGVDLAGVEGGVAVTADHLVRDDRGSAEGCFVEETKRGDKKAALEVYEVSEVIFC